MVNGHLHVENPLSGPSDASLFSRWQNNRYNKTRIKIQRRGGESDREGATGRRKNKRRGGVTEKEHARNNPTPFDGTL